MFDAVTLSAVTDELNEKILRGRVQEIVQLDALTFGFEIYAQHARRYLYATAHPDDARVHLVSTKLRSSGETPSPLLLSLRKHGDGAFINSITQLPHERVLKIQLDHSVEGISTLVIETIGKYSNIILLDADEMVIDAVKRVSSDMNRARVILPRHKYAPPPRQAKFAMSELTATEFAETLAENHGVRLWQVLVKTIAGVSPLLAREIAFRVAGKTDAACDPTQSGQLIETLGALSHASRQPTVAFEDGEPAAFAPYTLTQFADTRPFDSISAAIETFFGAPESYTAVKEPLLAQIAASRDRLARKRDALAQALPRAEEVERLKTSGELILAYAYQITPSQETLKAEIETSVVEVALDSHLSAVENAQKYFNKC